MIIIGVPGMWPSPSAFVTDLARQTDRQFLMADNVLVETRTGETFQVEVHSHEPRLRNAFRAAGGGRLEDELLDRIGAHTILVYCLADAPSVSRAEGVLRAGSALLVAGGIGVKVESAGIAHAAELWHSRTRTCTAHDLYRSFVVHVLDENAVQSCGMHNLALPDASVVSVDGNAEASDVLDSFLLYQLQEKPTLREGQTFATTRQSRPFCLHHVPGSPYEPDDPFHNPHGIWSLTPV
jgi:hypothetical protein